MKTVGGGRSGGAIAEPGADGAGPEATTDGVEHESSRVGISP
jgi:hypothetical protein